MAKREVKQSKKDRDRDILALCNRGQMWSPRLKSDAIKDIESGMHRYYVRVNGQEVEVHVVRRDGKKYLRTDPDKTTRNNLEELPECY